MAALGGGHLTCASDDPDTAMAFIPLNSSHMNCQKVRGLEVDAEVGPEMMVRAFVVLDWFARL